MDDFFTRFDHALTRTLSYPEREVLVPLLQQVEKLPGEKLCVQGEPTAGLYLISSGILKSPVLYLSDYLESHREEYYERLTLVREKNDLSGWLLFFLDGVAETAAKGVTTFDQILKFRQHWETEIARWKRHSTAGALLLPHLFAHPWINAASVAEVASVTPPTAYKILQTFTEAGLLREITGAQRGRLYLFEPYLQLFK